MARVKNVKRTDPALKTPKSSKKAKMVEACADSPETVERERRIYAAASPSIAVATTADILPNTQSVAEQAQSPHSNDGTPNVQSSSATPQIMAGVAQASTNLVTIAQYPSIAVGNGSLTAEDLATTLSDQETSDTSHAELAPASSSTLIFPSFDAAKSSLFRRELLDIANDDVDAVRDNQAEYVARIRDALLETESDEAPELFNKKELTDAQVTKWDAWQLDAQTKIDSIMESSRVARCTTSAQLRKATQMRSKSGVKSAARSDGLGRAVQRRTTKAEWAKLVADDKALKAQAAKKRRAMRKAERLAAAGGADEDEGADAADDEDSPQKQMKKSLTSGRTALKSVKRKARQLEEDEEELYDTRPVKKAKLVKKSRPSSQTSKRQTRTVDDEGGGEEEEDEEEESDELGDDSDGGQRSSLTKRATAPALGRFADYSESDSDAAAADEEDVSDWEQTNRSEKARASSGCPRTA
ncbi:hypothetical protein LTR95_003366 [Oleoguttula sp. CCFEE 5521]